MCNGYEDPRGMRRVHDGVCVPRYRPGVGQGDRSVRGLRPVRFRVRHLLLLGRVLRRLLRRVLQRVRLLLVLR